jgi:hypothetical protein
VVSLLSTRQRVIRIIECGTVSLEWKSGADAIVDELFYPIALEGVAGEGDQIAAQLEASPGAAHSFECSPVALERVCCSGCRGHVARPGTA